MYLLKTIANSYSRSVVHALVLISKCLPKWEWLWPGQSSRDIPDFVLLNVHMGTTEMIFCFFFSMKLMSSPKPQLCWPRTSWRGFRAEYDRHGKRWRSECQLSVNLRKVGWLKSSSFGGKHMAWASVLPRVDTGSFVTLFLGAGPSLEQDVLFWSAHLAFCIFSHISPLDWTISIRAFLSLFKCCELWKLSTQKQRDVQRQRQLRQLQK